MSLARQPALALPVIHLGSLDVSRLILGSNPVNGFSHQSDARSCAMVEWFTIERFFDLRPEAERCGITAIIARADQFVMRLLAEYWRAGGRIRWIAQPAPECADHAYNIRTAIDASARATFVHGGVVDGAFMDGQPEKGLLPDTPLLPTTPSRSDALGAVDLAVGQQCGVLQRVVGVVGIFSR